MGNNVDKYLTDLEHAGINHAGLPGVGSGGGDSFPIGAIVPFGASIASVPPGWLPCDGFAYGRTSLDPNPQPALFAVIGTTHGIGNGTTTFNVPDFRARSPLGLNDGSLPNGVLGSLATRSMAVAGGEENHVLTSAELASHSHGVTDPGHVHIILTALNQAGFFDPVDEYLRFTAENRANGTTVSATTGISIQASGSNTAHNTMHPFRVVPYIIKAQNLGGGAGGVSGQANGGSLVGPQPTLNLIPGTNVASVSVVNNVPMSRLDITINASTQTSILSADQDISSIAASGSRVFSNNNWMLVWVVGTNTSVTDELGFGTADKAELASANFTTATAFSLTTNTLVGSNDGPGSPSDIIRMTGGVDLQIVDNSANSFTLQGNGTGGDWSVLHFALGI